MALVLSRPVSISMVVIGAICMAINLIWTARRLRSRRERMYQELSGVLTERGWKPSLKFPQRVLKALEDTPFLPQVSRYPSQYECAQVYDVGSAALYADVLKWSTRSYRQNTIVVATETVGTPKPCLVAGQALSGPWSARTVWPLSPSFGYKGKLFVHFHGDVQAEDLPQIQRTMEIVDLIFGSAGGAFEGNSTALVRKTGVVVRGPILGTADGEPTHLEHFFAGVEHILDRCQEVWAERAGKD